MTYQFGHVILKIVGTRSLSVPVHAVVEDAGTYLLNPPYVAPSEHSEEYNEEEFDFVDNTPIFEPEDNFENGPEDEENINTITILTNVSLSPR